MTAGRGIVHSEMPQQTEGRMRGFQLWLNLPGNEKMKPAAYRDIPAREIPVVSFDAVKAKIIAGTLQGTSGPVHGGSTDPHYFDVILPPRATFDADLPAGHNAFAYAYEGEAFVGDERTLLPHRAAGLLSQGGSVRLEAGEAGARVLLLAARPLGEPVVQYGPFVMNTRAEIEQAVADYRSGTLSRA
jgi:hypothetical protein